MEQNPHFSVGLLCPTRRPRVPLSFVEDEFLIRICAAEMIRDGGYDVIEAIDADHAIAILEARRDIELYLRTFNSGIDGRTETWPTPSGTVGRRSRDISLTPNVERRSADRQCVFANSYSERSIVGTLHALTA